MSSAEPASDLFELHHIVLPASAEYNPQTGYQGWQAKTKTNLLLTCCINSELHKLLAIDSSYTSYKI